MPLIRYVTPYSTSKNLAETYNLEMELAPKGSYVAFLDRDCWFTQPKFGEYIEKIIEGNGQAYYTCVTNRTNCHWQRINATGCERYHVEVGKIRHEDYALTVKDCTDGQLWSGHLMICPKDLWIPLKTKGILGVDNEIHRNARKQGAKVYLMPGVYVWHWYSGFDGKNGNAKRDKTHLR